MLGPTIQRDFPLRNPYEKGWKGINIEPVQEWFELLEDKRPRDINLNLAVDLSEDEKTFNKLRIPDFRP